MSGHAVVVRADTVLPKTKLDRIREIAEDSFDTLELLFSNAKLTVIVDEAGTGYGVESILITSSGVFQAYSESTDIEYAVDEALRTIDVLLTNRNVAIGGVFT